MDKPNELILPPDIAEERARTRHEQEGVVTDGAGNTRVGIKYLMNHPGEFGYAIIVPDIRRDAPTMPITVEDSDLRDPTQQYALLKRKRDNAERKGENGGEVVRNDLLVHVDSGMFCVCVERVTGWNFRVEAILPPQTKEDMGKFLAAKPHGTGQWVVCGSAWTAEEVEAAKKRMGIIGKDPQIVSGEEAIAAQKEVSKHPDRTGWAAAGKKVFKDPKKIKNKHRAKYMQFLQGLGKTVDAHELAKDAERVVDTKDGKGQVIFWNTHKRMMRRIGRGENPLSE